ncbi:hypothetical protein QQ045_007556 [Rhodiola kirilowii]
MILAFGRWILPGLLDLVAIGVVVVAEVRDGADWLLEKASGGGSVYVGGGFGRGFGCYWSEASVGVWLDSGQVKALQQFPDVSFHGLRFLFLL